MSTTPHTNPSPQIPAGTVLDGRYEIGQRLAEGGFAKVYTGRQLNIARPVAIKVLNPTDESARQLVEEKFFLEAQSAGQITHPNVVTVFDYGLIGHQRQPYIVMELLQGHNLAQEVRHYGPMEPRRALKLFAGCLAALEEAHRLQIVHRDLKPANLFIVNPGTDQEMLKILDFGVARVRAANATSQTGNGQLLGSPRYLAPEYLKFHIATPTLDVYQMGLILIEMLTGRPVVTEANPFECIRVHTTADLSVPDDLIGGPLGPTILGALELDHTARFANAGQLRQSLMSVDFSAVKPPGAALRRLSDLSGGVRSVAARALEPGAPRSTGEQRSVQAPGGGFEPGGATVPVDMRQHVPMMAHQLGMAPAGQAAEQRLGQDDLDEEQTTEWSGRKLNEAVAARVGVAPSMEVSINLPPAPTVDGPMTAGATVVGAVPRRPPMPSAPAAALAPGASWDVRRPWVITALMIGGFIMFAGSLTCLISAIVYNPTAAPVIEPAAIDKGDGEQAPPQPNTDPIEGSGAVIPDPEEASEVDSEPPAAQKKDTVVLFSTIPAGASVKEFDAEVGKTPYKVRFKDGEQDARQLQVEKDGFRTVQVDISPQDAPSMTVKLDARKAPVVVKPNPTPPKPRPKAPVKQPVKKAPKKERAKPVLDKW